MANENVYLISKRIDSTLRLLGVTEEYETKDFKVACMLKQKLSEKNISTFLKDSDVCFNESDIQDISFAKVIILFVTNFDNLNLENQIIDKIQSTGNSKLEYIFFLTFDNIENINRDIDIRCLDGIVSKFVQISESYTIADLVNEVVNCLSTKHFKAEQSQIPNSLKESHLIGRPSAKFTDNVTPRDWLIAELDSWIKHPSSHIFWLSGEHGCGKTVFIGDYFKKISNVIGKGIYYCKYSSTQNQNVKHILKSIAYSLCTCVLGYLDYISNLGNDFYNNSSVDVLVTSLLIEPFEDNIDSSSLGNFVFVIDGIDELKIDVLDTFLEIIRDYSKSFPKFIKIIVTSTSMDNIYNTMKTLSVQMIDLLSPEYKDHKKTDAGSFLRNELKLLNIRCTDDEISTILEKAEYNFDYLHYFLAQCEERGSSFLLADELPIGLTAMFQSDFEQRFPEDFYNSQIKPILQVLVVANEPLSVVDLSQMLSLVMNKMQSIIKGVLKQFLQLLEENDTETVSLYNKSLQLWLVKKNHKFCVDEKKGNLVIVQWLEQNPSYLFENSYLIKYGITHILETKSQDKVKIISEKIENVNEDDFEFLKVMLSKMYMRTLKGGEAAQRSLLTIYRLNYSKNVNKYRDILVHTYRYVLKHKGVNATGLNDIYQILCDNNEEVRARLLQGEGISSPYDARKHFMETIEVAKRYIDESDKDGSWWHMRMLGVSYNRLANLEKKIGNIDEAEKQYENGKECFEKADKLLSDTCMVEVFKNDKIIIHRDEAIINERLGDISFEKSDFLHAAEHYKKYFCSCEKAYEARGTLKNKWDLSVSLLRLGDSVRYLGKFNEAKNYYRRAFNLRREILLAMHVENANLISATWPEFKCLDTQISSNVLPDRVPKESRDIDPIRDIALCHIRLGDLAFATDAFEAAKFFYGEFYKLCQHNNDKVGNESSRAELEISHERLRRITSITVEV